MRDTEQECEMTKCKCNYYIVCADCRAEIEELFGDDRRIFGIASYIRAFTLRWNAFLEREDCMVAEVYRDASAVCIKFIPVRREPRPPLIIKSHTDLVEVKERFPALDWNNSDLNYFDVFADGVFVIKANGEWTTGHGDVDAEETIRKRFIETLPEEWKRREH